MGGILHTPLLKFVAQTTSYLIFLSMIVTYSFSERNYQLDQRTIGDFPEIYSASLSANDSRVNNIVIRQLDMNPLMIMIFLWIIGKKEIFLWHSMSKL